MLCVKLYKKHTPGWFVVLAEEIKALIGNRHPALIWLNCTEWKVLCSSLAFSQHIEKGGFPAVRKTSALIQPALDEPFIYLHANQ